MSLTAALKEWAIAVEALTTGDLILLLRKGGIRERDFAVPERQIWLYPTYEHQKPHLLKPDYADRVQPVPSGWHPNQVEIRAWADITHVFEISESATVEALLPFHIWNPQFVTERLKWKPRSPLSVLLLRVHQIPPKTILYRGTYGGCKSWIDLGVDLDSRTATPVLSDADYQNRVSAIEQVINFYSRPS